MGCAVSKPKVKGDKSPPDKVPDTTSASQQRRQTNASTNQSSLQSNSGAGAITAPGSLPGVDAAPKDQSSLSKVASSKIRPSSQAAAPAEEIQEKRKERAESIPRPLVKSLEGEQISAGWPAWLASVAGEAIKGWVPRRADSFEKLDKIGQGTYSNVYKARDLETGKLVALKKVRFDNLEPESVRFMAREIEVLRRLEHPNIVKLEGLVTSRMSASLYLVFEYMEHDLAGLAACPGVKFTESQVKCYMQQLMSGLEHCHTNGVLHRDIKGSNLLLDNTGTLKIADFGLATFYRPEQNVPLTSRVVTLWYRPPELLLGATHYGVAVDLWSAGCILAELLAGKPIMPGRTEVEQLHKIFKLCGSPSEDYWRKSKLPHATIFKPSQPYKRNLKDIFKDFPATSLALLDILLAIEPSDRGTATAALKHDFFTTEPLPCDPDSLPDYPPSKEYDAKLRDEEARRSKAAGSRASRGGAQDKEKRNTTSLVQQQPTQSKSKAVPAPLANAELRESITVQKDSGKGSGVGKSSSERFLSDGGQAPAVSQSLAVSSSQFKPLDTPEAPAPGGGRKGDRDLHRTGTNTRLAGGTAWNEAGNAAPGRVSTGKLPANADIGDRSISMARASKAGPSGQVSTRDSLQAGDVSFALQKKSGAVSGELAFPRNRVGLTDDRDSDLSFQGPPIPKGNQLPKTGGASSTARKSGPLLDRQRDPKNWMLPQASGEFTPGALATAAGADSSLSKTLGVSKNGVFDLSPKSKEQGKGSPAKDRLADLAGGSPNALNVTSSWDTSSKSKTIGEGSLGSQSRKNASVSNTSSLVGIDATAAVAAFATAQKD